MALERRPHGRAGAGERRRDTVVFTLNQPYAPFLSTLTQLFIVNRDQVLANKKPGTFGELGDYGEAYLGEKTAGSGPYTKESWDRATTLVMKAFPALLAGMEAQPDHPRDLPHRPGGGDHADAPPRRAGRHDRPVADAHDLRAAAEDTGHRRRRDAERPALPHPAEHSAGAAVRRPRPESARVAFDYKTAIEQIFKGAALAKGPLPNRVYGHSENVQAYGRTSSRPSGAGGRRRQARSAHVRLLVPDRERARPADRPPLPVEPRRHRGQAEPQGDAVGPDGPGVGQRRDQPRRGVDLRHAQVPAPGQPHLWDVSPERVGQLPHDQPLQERRGHQRPGPGARDRRA